MSEQKTIDEIEGTKVPIKLIRPGVTEITLEDGAVIELHVTPADVRRFDDQKRDDAGNPVYAVNSQMLLRILHGPDSLK